MENLLTANNLRYFYAQQCAVNNISITLSRGETVGLLGQNGAGKSTILKMITGNLSPAEGDIMVAGTDLLENPDVAKRSIGYLPDQPPLYNDLWVDEYLAYSARLHYIPRREIAAAVNKVKQRCELSSCGRRLIGQLSKGYRQRLGIAQALIHEPDLIVLDEPTVGLDPVQIRELRDLIRELASERGIILSTHILPEVESLCNRVEILHQGEILYSDRLDNRASETLSVQLAAPPTLEQLRQLSCVESAQLLEQNRFLLQPAEGVAPQEVATHLVRWGLQALKPQRRSLEQVFIQLTSGEVGS